MTIVARPCLTCGHPASGTRCTACEQAHRGTTTQRGYGATHQAEREQWSVYMNGGADVDCSRCHHPIRPGELWDLGHDDHDRREYTGPEHVSCNRGASA